MLDENEDGFITVSEFMKNIGKLANFAEVIKEGLFAYFDV